MSAGSKTQPPRSDAEMLARTRVLAGSVMVYLLCMGFMALGDHFYVDTPYLLYSRLATLPFFLLLVRRWIGLVRVRPPQVLLEARKLMELGRHEAARERFASAQNQEPALAARVNRARRLLQDGLAVTLLQETQLEIARCSLLLDEVDRAVSEMGEVQAQLPLRADVALELAEALRRAGKQQQAEAVLREALPQMDAVDRETLVECPQLLELLGDTPLPSRSQFYRKIIRDRLVLLGLVVLAILHGLHLYL